jgi:hypothetical protein
MRRLAQTFPIFSLNARGTDATFPFRTEHLSCSPLNCAETQSMNAERSQFAVLLSVAMFASRPISKKPETFSLFKPFAIVTC